MHVEQIIYRHRIKTTHYLADGNIDCISEFDSNGNIILYKVYEYGSDGSILYWTVEDYDNDGKRTGKIKYNADGSIGYISEYINGEAIKTTYYNSDGSVSFVWNK